MVRCYKILIIFKMLLILKCLFLLYTIINDLHVCNVHNQSRQMSIYLFVVMKFLISSILLSRAEFIFFINAVLKRRQFTQPYLVRIRINESFSKYKTGLLYLYEKRGTMHGLAFKKWHPAIGFTKMSATE